MAYDLKRTHSSFKPGRKLAAGSVVEQEGVILCSKLEDGEEKAELVASVSGSEVPLGFATTADSLPDRTSEVEEPTVPSSGALEVDLRNTNLVSGRIRAVVVSSGTPLTIDTTYAGVTADGQVKVDLATGRLKFHSDEAGEKVKVTYLYDLTRQEAKQRFGERHINNQGLHEIHGAIELGSGIVELYTDQYDASADWSAGGVIKLGDGGQLVKAGSGPDLDLEVVQVPSVSSPYLGVRGSIGVAK